MTDEGQGLQLFPIPPGTALQVSGECCGQCRSRVKLGKHGKWTKLVTDKKLPRVRGVKKKKKGSSLVISASSSFLGCMSSEWRNVRGNYWTNRWHPTAHPAERSAAVCSSRQQHFPQSRGSVCVSLTCNAHRNGRGQIDHFSTLPPVSDDGL